MDLSFPSPVPDDDAAAPAALSPAEVAALRAALRRGPARADLVAGAFNPAMAERLRDWFRAVPGRSGGGTS